MIVSTVPVLTEAMVWIGLGFKLISTSSSSVRSSVCLHMMSRSRKGGEPTLLHEGMLIEVYDDDVDDDGNPDKLMAQGVVERNKSTGHHLSQVKWCCRIDHNGIQHESDRKIVD